MKKTRKIKHIISGGQSGVDRSALDFSIKHNIPHSGYCPNGRWAEDGIIAPKYNLTETDSKDPQVRTKLNVENAAGTLIIYQKIDKGTRQTLAFCSQFEKPYFIIEVNKGYSGTEFQHWLALNNIETLNIAGPRESNDPGIYQKSYKILTDILLR